MRITCPSESPSAAARITDDNGENLPFAVTHATVCVNWKENTLPRLYLSGLMPGIDISGTLGEAVVEIDGKSYRLVELQPSEKTAIGESHRTG